MLEEWLKPVSVAAFVEEYFGSKPLCLTGRRERFRGLYSLERFRDLLARSREVQPGGMIVTATFDRRWGAEAEPVPDLQIAPSTAETAYRAGATICVEGLQRAAPELEAVCRQVAAQLGYPGYVGMKAYWSPDGCGFQPHFDGRMATTLQLAGTKRWRFSTRPAVAWPRRSALPHGQGLRYLSRTATLSWTFDAGPHEDWEVSADPASFADWKEVLLEHGDLLCVPAGAWHAAEAEGESFALNLHFDAKPFGSFVGDALDAKLSSDPAWRAVPPLLAGSGIYQGLSPAAIASIRAGLDQAIAQLSEWRRDPTGLIRQWAGGLTSRLSGPASPPPEDVMISGDTVVQLSPTLMVIAASIDSMYLVVAGGNEVEAEGSSARILRAALAAKRFRVDDVVVDGVERATVRQAIAALLKAGVLRIVTPEI